MARGKNTATSTSNGREPRTPSPTRQSAEAISSVTSSPERPLSPLSVVVPPEEREIIRVSNYNVTELKHACDDALKRYLSRPDLFKQSHAHTDVKLALGWLSVFVAGGTAFYGYKVEFEQSKPVVWAGLLLYILLTSLQALYAYFVEGEVVFVGKRKSFSKRILTERITISSRTRPVTKATPPAYGLSLSYLRSTSGGKSLLAKGKHHGVKEYNAFFDDKGTMDQERFERWVAELVDQALEGKTS